MTQTMTQSRGDFTLAFAPNGRMLATSDGKNGIRLWDVLASSLQGGARPVKPSRKELEAAWADLADQDATKAHEGICRLVGWDKDAVSFLNEIVQKAPQPDPEKVSQFVTELESNRFDVRKKAQEELEKLGDLAESALEKALANNPSVEKRRQLEELLKRMQGFITSPERLRAIRVIEVLEHIGTPEARDALGALTRGKPGTDLTEGAKAALERLAKRPVLNP